MKKESNWLKLLYSAGVVAMLIGAIDPLEGSALILAGSISMAISTHLSNDAYHAIFLSSTALIMVGIFFLFFFSDMGGFGKGALSWCWAILVVPYPVGWLISIVTMIVRASRKPHHHAFV